MSRKTMSTRRLTRREKLAQERKEILEVKKFEEASPKPLPRLELKNQRQKTGMEALRAGKKVVVLTGSAGTGKSLLACRRASEQFHEKRLKKLYLVRPAVSVGKSIGLLPGEIEEKMAPYFKQTIAHLEWNLGKSFVEYALEKKIIEMVPAEYMRGMSLEDCIVIVEEGQNFLADEFEMTLTRIGENCQMIITGDTKQHDLKGRSGLDITLELIDRMLQTQPEYMTNEDLDELDDNITVVRFMPSDVVRSGLTKALVTAYYHNGATK